eukprot:8034327-Alexandrium_andersonii.AAC.1
MSTPRARLRKPAQGVHHSVLEGQGRIVTHAAAVDAAPAEHHGYVALPVADLAEVADPFRATARRVASHGT